MALLGVRVRGRVGVIRVRVRVIRVRVRVVRVCLNFHAEVRHTPCRTGPKLRLSVRVRVSVRDTLGLGCQGWVGTRAAWPNRVTCRSIKRGGGAGPAPGLSLATVTCQA